MTDAIPREKKRIFELDLLRGFFIFVIIVDHIQRWPSPLTYVTGEGRLWMSAAEGFFIISGLLIGYLRGYKGLKKSFPEISKLLVKRAALLYVWSVIITLIAVWLIQIFGSNLTLLPRMPETSGLAYFWQVITQQYVFDWIYFLRLYWIMLLVTPVVIWLFRIKKWWLVPIVSLTVYSLSFLLETPEAALQWQALFFIPATIGFHLDRIIQFMKTRKKLVTALVWSLISFTLATMVLSYFWVLGWDYVKSPDARVSFESYVSTRNWLDPYFSKDPLAPGRLILSFIWFGGLLALFHIAKEAILKWLGWLLMPFGQYSLTAYCIQAVALLFLQFWILPNQTKEINLLIGLLSVALVWILLKSKIVRHILPQ